MDQPGPASLTHRAGTWPWLYLPILRLFVVLRLSRIVYVFYICLYIYLSSGKYNTSLVLANLDQGRAGRTLLRSCQVFSDQSSGELMIYTELFSAQTNLALIHFISDNL